VDEEKLVAKKEVLEKTGISYGQLYRWKRKGLIPEGWFVRRSTFTGQETFFPEEKILERIERIKDLKEEHALDDLALLITQKANAALEIALERLRALDWWNESLERMCCPPHPPRPPRSGEDKVETVSLNEVFCGATLYRLQGAARPEELDLTKRTLDQGLAANLIERLRQERLFLFLLRKRLAAAGIQAEISAAVVAAEGAVFDPEMEVVRTVDLGGVLERIKLDLAKEGG
jgi:DNA-binding transcriptional MerR regulator